MLPLIIQIGAVRIEPVSRRLLRVYAGSDQPAVLNAIRRAGGRLDGTKRCFWVPAAKLPKLETELRVNPDLFRCYKEELASGERPSPPAQENRTVISGVPIP
jgi:hypothetical protein